MITNETHQPKIVSKATFRTEFIAGLSTFLTLSYIFLLNPILLSKTGINISAAFFATVISAALSTLLMGFWARLPFAVAPAPSITTFFVSYVCIKLGLSWQAALSAVVLSGLLSIVMTYLSVRGKLIESISPGLRSGVLFALSGFLIANGLTQAKLFAYSEGFLDFSKFSFSIPNTIVLLVGLLTTLLFRIKRIRFSGAPIIGIVVASIVASYFGIKANSKAEFSSDMFSSIGNLDFSTLLDERFLLSMLVFFIIDFFGGVGKYIGLFAAMDNKARELEEKNIGRALYVDGIGNIIGGILGASSLAVFVSSAVGILAGGRTGMTAIVTAGFMLLSLAIIPLVGAIPVEVTSGILVYVGCLLIPYDALFDKVHRNFTRFDLAVSVAAAIISFTTYGIDKAILLVFLVYTGQIVLKGARREDLTLIVTTLLLLAAVVAQSLL
ncbi:hypothetical protein MUK70_19130 [Dyadobacter chenwenxiniae]|uniref:MFS transporter, AGZA family, xanthine/uracil permease n=1 Tax=Dyadobacter chenwenxiniae TaxID=2906456 RepID=A0A9X1PJ78_9BACT|nr:NCS2 family permease [Dyadobacter chenwenxiniae]MCF0061355.1 hypothetical protein [Dyadobacter chenwenxiniae]UON81177.1 hypothetical protein MUK70_19130 [Dyadobacter chenwenxiniae]